VIRTVSSPHSQRLAHFHFYPSLVEDLNISHYDEKEGRMIGSIRAHQKEIECFLHGEALTWTCSLDSSIKIWTDVSQ